MIARLVQSSRWLFIGLATLPLVLALETTELAESMTSSIRYSVRRDGENSVIKIRGRDLTQANLSNLFGLVPSTISFLSEDSEVETADASGTFRTESMDNLQYWLCRGTPFYTSSCAMASSRYTAAEHRSLTTTVSSRTSAASSLVGSMPV